MSDSPQLKVAYSPDTEIDIKSITEYLGSEFTQKEIENFFHLLDDFEARVSLFPKSYPYSSKRLRIRRAVLSKQLSVYYFLYKRKSIEIVAIKDNRFDNSAWI